jgi:hypothetical protein
MGVACRTLERQHIYPMCKPLPHCRYQVVQDWLKAFCTSQAEMNTLHT